MSENTALTVTAGGELAAADPLADFGKFLRLHAAEGEFVPIELWDRLTEPGLEIKPDDREPLILAVDASVSGDATALAVVSRHPVRRQDVAIRGVEIWLPPVGGKIDYDATLLPALLRWCEQGNVLEICYDPYQMHHFMSTFRERGLAWVRPFDQGAERVRADSALYERIRGKGIVHDGNPLLRRHVQNSAARCTDDSKLRIVKRGRGPIDGIVAVSMAAWECARLNL